MVCLLFYWYPTDYRADMSDRHARGGFAGFGLGRAGPTKCQIERLFRLTAECGDSRTATPFSISLVCMCKVWQLWAPACLPAHARLGMDLTERGIDLVLLKNPREMSQTLYSNNTGRMGKSSPKPSIQTTRAEWKKVAGGHRHGHGHIAIACKLSL